MRLGIRVVAGAVVLLGIACGDTGESTTGPEAGAVAATTQVGRAATSSVAPANSTSVPTAEATTTTTSTTVVTTTVAPIATTPSEQETAIEAPSVEVVWFFADSGETFFRFLSFVHNPNDVPLRGVVTHWEAYDEDDVLVGSFVRRFPVIDPGISFPYVGGAGGANLTGTPTRAELFLDDPGDPAPDAISPLLEVESVSLSRPFDLWAAEAVVVSPDRPIRGADLGAVWILYDSEGNVVAADFGFDLLLQLPDTIRPNTKVRVTDTLDSMTGTPAEVEVVVFEDR